MKRKDKLERNGEAVACWLAAKAREPKMPFALRYVRPDEIAECWEGVSKEGYRELWGFVAEMKPMPTEYPPDPGFNNAGKFWKRMSDSLKAELVAICERMDAEERARRRRFNAELDAKLGLRRE